MNRRVLLIAIPLLLLAVSPAAAEYKPTRPVEFVVHNGPGSGNDVFARALVQVIEREKLMPVRIAGGQQGRRRQHHGGRLRHREDRRSDVIAVFVNIWLTDPLVQPAATAKTARHDPIALVQIEPALVVTRADSPYRTLADFIAAAKAEARPAQAGGRLDHVARERGAAVADDA